MNYYLIKLISDLNNFLPHVMVKLLKLTINFFSLYKMSIAVLMTSKENSFFRIEVN